MNKLPPSLLMPADSIKPIFKTTKVRGSSKGKENIVSPPIRAKTKGKSNEKKDVPSFSSVMSSSFQEIRSVILVPEEPEGTLSSAPQVQVSQEDIETPAEKVVKSGP